MSRAASWSQCTWLSTRWVRQGRASPICSASCQPFLRGAPLSKASRYSPVCRRGSGRTNKGPSGCFRTSSSSRRASRPSVSTNLCHPENRQIRGTGGEPDGKLNCSTRVDESEPAQNTVIREHQKNCGNHLPVEGDPGHLTEHMRSPCKCRSERRN